MNEGAALYGGGGGGGYYGGGGGGGFCGVNFEIPVTGGGGGSSYVSPEAQNASFGLDPTRTPQVTVTPITPPIPGDPAPAVSGTARVGLTLSASTGAWSGTPPISYSYQWQLCTPGCSNIAGATASSLALTAAEVGSAVRVAVTASNSAGSAQATSSETGPILAVGPTPGQVRAALLQALAPSGKRATIEMLLKQGGYAFSFTAPTAGRLVISWYHAPTSARPAKARTPLLVATVNVTFHQARTTKIKIALTSKGRKLLETAKRLNLTATGSFSPTSVAATSATKKITLKR